MRSNVHPIDKVAESHAQSAITQTDEELWDAFMKTNHIPAFDEIYSRHGQRLVLYFAGQNKGCGLVDASELANEVFTKAIKNKTSFDPNRGTFASWLYGIARHTNSGIFRGLVLLLCAQKDEIDSNLFVASGEDPEAKIDIRKCIKRLPKGQRNVIYLEYFAGLTGREIATMLKIPEGTVSSRKHNAIRGLRRMLGGSRQV